MSTKKRVVIISLLIFGIFLSYRYNSEKMADLSTSEGLGIWISAFLTLFIMSFLYADNPFYKFAEHLFVGVSAAYWMVMTFWSTLFQNCLIKLYPSLFVNFNPELTKESPQFHYILPLLFGCMLLCLLIPKISWLSRWAIAFIVGATAGTYFIRYLISDFFTQVQQTMVSLITTTSQGISISQSISAVIVVLGVLTGLVYFFYSKEHKGWFGKTSRVGIWVLMIAFGAHFGYTVMGRIALLVGRMQEIFVDWLQLIPQG